MSNGTGRSDLKKAIADHIQQTTGQIPIDAELESSANALVSFVRLLAEADQKLMKESNERNNRNPDHSD